MKRSKNTGKQGTCFLDLTFATSAEPEIFQHIDCCIPGILPFVPIRPLGCADFASHGHRSNLPGSVLQICAKMAPKSVNDLRSSLDSQGLLRIWQLVCPNLCKVGFHPCRFAFNEDFLLLMHNIIVQHAWHSKLIGFGSICMSDDVLVLQEL